MSRTDPFPGQDDSVNNRNQAEQMGKKNQAGIETIETIRWQGSGSLNVIVARASIHEIVVNNQAEHEYREENGSENDNSKNVRSIDLNNVMEGM